MDLNVPELERRLVDLQSQLERVRQLTQNNVQTVEQRLAGMAEHAEDLKRWAITAERHAGAVTQLDSYVSEWKDANSRVHEDTAKRLRELEALIQHEWDTTRKIYEQPVKELREHAASLTEVCIATARVAQKGFDRAEARLASFEDDFQRRLNDFSRDLQSAVAEIKMRAPHQSPQLDGASPWPFDDVTRLHSQLRDLDAISVAAANSARVVGQSVVGLDELVPSTRSRIEERKEQTETEARRALDAPGRPILEVQTGSERAAWSARLAGLALGLALILAVGFGWQLQNQVRAAEGRARDAEIGFRQAAADAENEAAAARQQAEREIATARETASRAERIGNVLAAPDLIRYSLAGGVGTPAASGQALWSRTRGLVFSGSRIPPPPSDGAHQLWLLTRQVAVKAATFMPEPDGTVTLVDQAPAVSGPVVGLIVTAERGNIGESPSGQIILTSARAVE